MNKLSGRGGIGRRATLRAIVGFNLWKFKSSRPHTIMKYIYKHGNQYWYQRAIPKNLLNSIGKKSIKVSLKINKVSTALVRAKLQSSEHKKMFKKIENRKFSLKFLKN